MITILNYIKRDRHAKSKARANLEYIATRVNKEKEKVDRPLFGHDGPRTKALAQMMIDGAPDNTLFWRLKLSGDPNSVEEDRERNLDLWKLTTGSVQWLEGRLEREIPFVGVEHDDHTDIRHVHALLLILRQGRETLITPKTLEDFRTEVARLAVKQHEIPGQAVTLEELQQAHQRRQEAPSFREASVSYRMQSRAPAAHSYGVKGGSARRSREDRPTCPNCGIGTVMQRLKDGRARCGNCGIILSAGREREVEVEWSR